jgi:hypothetical protein
MMMIIISSSDTSNVGCLQPIKIHNEVLKLCENNSFIRRLWNAGSKLVEFFCQARRRDNTKSHRVQKREA